MGPATVYVIDIHCFSDNVKFLAGGKVENSCRNDSPYGLE